MISRTRCSRGRGTYARSLRLSRRSVRENCDSWRDCRKQPVGVLPCVGFFDETTCPRLSMDVAAIFGCPWLLLIRMDVGGSDAKTDCGHRRDLACHVRVVAGVCPRRAVKRGLANKRSWSPRGRPPARQARRPRRDCLDRPGEPDARGRLFFRAEGRGRARPARAWQRRSTIRVSSALSSASGRMISGSS